MTTRLMPYQLQSEHTAAGTWRLPDSSGRRGFPAVEPTTVCDAFKTVVKTTAGTVLVLIGTVFGVGPMIAGAVLGDIKLGHSYTDMAFTGDALVQSNPFDNVYSAFCGVYVASSPSPTNWYDLDYTQTNRTLVELHASQMCVYGTAVKGSCTAQGLCTNHPDVYAPLSLLLFLVGSGVVAMISSMLTLLTCIKYEQRRAAVVAFMSRRNPRQCRSDTNAHSVA